MTTAEQVADRNYRYFKGRARNELPDKCYDCPKFTYYGRTCKGKCDKGGEK